MILENLREYMGFPKSSALLWLAHRNIFKTALKPY